MEVKLYQINLDRDEDGLAFMGQEYLSKQKDDPTQIDSQIYLDESRLEEPESQVEAVT